MIRNHPRGLPVLFLSEMWERFGFYIVTGLLILYMTQVFKFSDDKGYAILGVFTALVYIVQVAGGYLADSLLGFKKAIFIGNVLLILGYALLAAPGTYLFYIALSVIVMGSGYFKPNISSLLGTLYKRRDPRREAGFTIFYMGINIGSLLSAISGGFIKQLYGWHASFGVASFGLLIGIGIFVLGTSRLEKHGGIPKQYPYSKLATILRSNASIFIGTVLAVMLCSVLLRHGGFANILIATTGIGLLGGLIAIAYTYKPEVRKKLLALIILIIMATVLWSIWFQIFFSANLFTERVVDRTLFNVTIPAIMFLSIEAGFIVILSPFFASLWLKLSERNINISIPMKFSLGAFAIALGFFVLYISTHFPNHQGKINMYWIVLSYFCLTLGDLLFSPIGLSAVTVLSPKGRVGLMMGAWFVSIGIGGDIAGLLARLSSIPKHAMDLAYDERIYGAAFLDYTLIALVAGIVMLLLTPKINKLIKG